jgi:hypothetical protein
MRDGDTGAEDRISPSAGPFNGGDSHSNEHCARPDSWSRSASPAVLARPPGLSARSRTAGRDRRSSRRAAATSAVKSGEVADGAAPPGGKAAPSAQSGCASDLSTGGLVPHPQDLTTAQSIGPHDSPKVDLLAGQRATVRFPLSQATSGANRGSATKNLNDIVVRIKQGKSPFSRSQPRPAATDPLGSLKRANPELAKRLGHKR